MGIYASVMRQMATPCRRRSIPLLLAEAEIDRIEALCEAVAPASARAALEVLERELLPHHIAATT